MRKGGTDGLAAAILYLSSKLVMSPAGCCLTVLLKLNTPAEVRFEQVNFSEVVKERRGAGKIRRDVWNGEDGSECGSGASVSLLY